MPTLLAMTDDEAKEVRRTSVVTARLTAEEREVWDATRRALGGPVAVLTDAQAVRHAMAKLVRATGLKWPGGES